MKLVEILAKEMSKWPSGFNDVGQAFAGELHLPGIGEHVRHTKEKYTRSEDWGTAIVTHAQWQAERDRQKGGEWKRHRGGKCPVSAGSKVSTRHRYGKVVDVHFHTATTNSGAATMNAIWKHTGDAHDIMSYKVISQPSSKAEARAPFGGDPIVEYAFGAPGEDIASLDWKPLGHGRISDIEFDDVTTEEVDVKDTTIGTLSYKVEIDATEATQAIDELAAKWDQIETPFKWRDEVTELNAYIEKYTRERDALIERLASEGFALIPAMTPVMGVADIDMGDWRNWKEGDIVEVVIKNDCDFPIGKQYPVSQIEKPGYEGGMPVMIKDEDGCEYWAEDSEYDLRHVFKFIRRP